MQEMQETQIQFLTSSRRLPGEGNGNPLQYSCLGNPKNRGACLATVHGTAKSELQLSYSVYTYICMYTGEGNGTPLQYSCLENPMDGGAWQAAVHGEAKSQTRLSDFTFTFHFHALEKEMAAHSSVLAWRILGRGSLVGCRLWGLTESDTTEVTQHSIACMYIHINTFPGKTCF